MKKRNIYTFALLFLASGYIFAQSPKGDFSKFTACRSQGTLPVIFTQLGQAKYQGETAKKTSLNTATRDVRKLTNQFLLKSSYSIDKMINSGRVLYGDPITVYINKVAKEILKDNPELQKQLSLYTFKSSTVNASCSNQGIILVNIGLIAHLQTEAQLAFVLSHEIAHFEKQHALNSYVENYEILKGKGNYSRKSFDEKIDLLFQFSKESELEADSIGILRYLNSSYSTKELESGFDMLHYSYLPFEEVAFDKSFFNDGEFIIPDVYFKDSVSRISAIENYNDKYHTHPNIGTRKERMRW